MAHYQGIGELLFGVGALVLAVALGWAIMRNRHRNRANDAVTDAATRALQKDPESYDPEKFRAQLKPER